MTDENEPKFPDRDGMLGILVSLVNESGIEMGITLTVPGGQIQGLLISHSKWLGLLEEWVAAANSDMRGMISAFRDSETEDDTDEEDPEPVRHVHLQDARYLQEQAFMPDFDKPGLLWRGRLSEIAGWSLGSFSRNE